MMPLLNPPLEGEPVDDLTPLRDELEALRSRVDSLEADRQKLGTMLYSLRAIISGDPESVASSPASSSPTPHNRAAWEAWKQQLPTGCGKIIDALLVQPLRPSQMISMCKMAYPTITANLRILASNGLTEKDGGRVRLKKL